MGENNPHSLSLYKKSLVLRDLGNALKHYFSSDTKEFSSKTLGLRTIIAESIATDTSLIPATIEQAFYSNSNSLRLRNATFVNVITRNILSYCNGLEKDGIKEKEYLQLLRKEVKTFRKSFKKWRKSLLSDGGY